MVIVEQVMTQVARHLGLPPEELRWCNMYKEGDVTPYGMPLNNCTLRRCWEELQESASFASRKCAVAAFNR